MHQRIIVDYKHRYPKSVFIIRDIILFLQLACHLGHASRMPRNRFAGLDVDKQGPRESTSLSMCPIEVVLSKFFHQRQSSSAELRDKVDNFICIYIYSTYLTSLCSDSSERLIMVPTKQSILINLQTLVCLPFSPFKISRRL